MDFPPRLGHSQVSVPGELRPCIPVRAYRLLGVTPDELWTSLRMDMGHRI
jgi:hypothetical protein